MLHIARVQLFRALVHQGPKQRHTDVLQNAHLVFTSTIDGELDPYLDALAERVPEADEWWGRCAGYPGRARPRRLPRLRARRSRRGPGSFQSAIPDATVGEVREALALRERVIDFAVEAQGLDAAALQARFRSDVLMLGRPPNVPRRAGKPAHIDLADIQGNVLRGYTMPAAAYLFLRIVDVGKARALMTRMLPQVMTAAPWRRPPADGDERGVHVRRACAALGLPDARAGVLPRGLPRRHGGARRAARRPRPERAVGVGVQRRRTCS